MTSKTANLIADLIASAEEYCDVPEPREKPRLLVDDSNPDTAVATLLRSVHRGSIEVSTGWTDAHDERAATVEFDGGAARAWAEGFARLDPTCPPSDVPPKRWLRFIDDCGTFLDDGWAAKAAALGWGPADLFGCDRHKPYARIDSMGLLWLLNGRKLIALSAGAAAIPTASGSNLTYSSRPNEPGRVLAWELVP
jgi:hypothetical protein